MRCKTVLRCSTPSATTRASRRRHVTCRGAVESRDHEFTSTSTILFLNKKDIFQTRIQHMPLNACFPDYEGLSLSHWAISVFSLLPVVFSFQSWVLFSVCGCVLYFVLWAFAWQYTKYHEIKIKKYIWKTISRLYKFCSDCNQKHRNLLVTIRWVSSYIKPSLRKQGV